MQLLVRQREVYALRDVLRHVHSLPANQRLNWLNDNGQTMSNAFSLIVDVSEKALSQVPTDSESLALTTQLIEALRETEQLATDLFEHSHAGLSS